MSNKNQNGLDIQNNSKPNSRIGNAQSFIDPAMPNSRGSKVNYSGHKRNLTQTYDDGTSHMQENDGMMGRN